MRGFGGAHREPRLLDLEPQLLLDGVALGLDGREVGLRFAHLGRDEHALEEGPRERDRAFQFQRRLSSCWPASVRPVDAPSCGP